MPRTDSSDAQASGEPGEDLTGLHAQLLDQSYDAILVWDLHGAIRLWNRGAASLYGYSKAESLGKVSHDLLRTAADFPIPRLIETLSDLGVWEGELRHIARDGTHLTVESRMVLVERDGHRLVLEANRDITERKCTEILLARLAAIVESSDDAIIAKDLAGIITDWNAGAETIFGYSAREMIGQSILRLIPLDRRQEEAVILEKLRQGQSVPHFDTIRQHKTGAFIDVSVTVSAIKDATGNVVGASKIARDISTRKRADEAIRQLNAELEERVTQRTKDLAAANKELEAFSFSVSHDLRAPLRSIIGFSQIASDDYGAALPESGRRCLTTIRESAMQMNTLIDDLLTFARFTATPLQSREIDVNLLVGNVIAQLSGTLEKRQIDWHIGDLPDCPGDPALLRQVWMNLLSNALKYTRKKDSARIEVRGEAQSGQVTYFVRDNGTGFDMRYAHKLFGVFQRLHRSEDYEGNGIGLALAQRIVRRHGGCLWAEAVPGQGATFYVSLPRTRRHEDHLDNAPQI